MPLIGTFRHKMDPRLDHGFSASLRDQGSSNGVQYLVIIKGECLGIQSIDIVDPNFLHVFAFYDNVTMPAGANAHRRGGRYLPSRMTTSPANRYRHIGKVVARNSKAVDLRVGLFDEAFFLQELNGNIMRFFALDLDFGIQIAHYRIVEVGADVF